MLLKDLPEDARPREKLLARGPAALTDAELLALLLRTGPPGPRVCRWRRSCLTPLAALPGCCTPAADALKSHQGPGRPANAPGWWRCWSLARRALEPAASWNASVRHAQALRDYLQLQLGSRPHEIFAALFLDSQNRLVGWKNCFAER